jgi:hypothetical protein
MRVAFAILALLLATHAQVLSQATSPTNEQIAPDAGFGDVAPADEYFGNLQLSVLGIRNELRDLQAEIQTAPQRSDVVLLTAGLVEDAVTDWEAHYPADPWLPKTLYALEQVYLKIRSPAGHQAAMRVVSRLTSRYSNSIFAREALRDVRYACSSQLACYGTLTH